MKIQKKGSIGLAFILLGTISKADSYTVSTPSTLSLGTSALDPCLIALTLAPAAPDAPPAPSTPTAPSRPKPATEPARRAPHPFPPTPGQPVRQPTPVDDPKDLLPEGLYMEDTASRRIFENLPESLRQEMSRATTQELRDLKNRLKVKVGFFWKRTISAKTLLRKIEAILVQSDKIETNLKPQIQDFVRKKIISTYGQDVSGKLQIELSSELPAYPASPSPRRRWNDGMEAGGGDERLRLFPAHPGQEPAYSPLTESDTFFFSYRRELYNLLAQAAGWQSMRICAFDHAEELANIDSRLPLLYQTFYHSFRLLNFYLVKGVAKALDLNQSGIKEQGSIGREIVTTEFELVRDLDESLSLELKKIHGISVGKNGLALIHEAHKAAFQMASPMEASQRSVLTPEERHTIDQITNSNTAEIRQAIYGMAVSDRIFHSLNVIYGPGSHLDKIEKIFSFLPERVFYTVVTQLSDPDLEGNSEKQRLLKGTLSEWVGR